jgi:hypothetical protein
MVLAEYAPPGRSDRTHYAEDDATTTGPVSPLTRLHPQRATTDQPFLQAAAALRLVGAHLRILCARY